MKHSAVCSRGNTLNSSYIQRSTLLAQTAVFEFLTVALIQNEAFCDLTLCRSVHCNDMSQDPLSSKFRILFSDCLNPDKGGSWFLWNFRNFIPIYMQHIPEALRLHCSNFSLYCIQNQANSPDFTSYSSKRDTLLPTYSYQDERKMLDNPERCKLIFFL